MIYPPVAHRSKLYGYAADRRMCLYVRGIMRHALHSHYELLFVNESFQICLNNGSLSSTPIERFQIQITHKLPILEILPKITHTVTLQNLLLITY